MTVVTAIKDDVGIVEKLKKEMEMKKTLLELMVECEHEWPDGAEFASQNKRDKDLYFYRAKPERLKGDDHWSEPNSSLVYWHTLPSLCKNWHQTIVTREQYEEAIDNLNVHLPLAKADESMALQDELDKGVASAVVTGPYAHESTVHYANCAGTRSSILLTGKRMIAQHFDYIFMLDYQENITELWTNEFDWVLKNMVVSGDAELSSAGRLALRYLLTLIKRVYESRPEVHLEKPLNATYSIEDKLSDYKHAKNELSEVNILADQWTLKIKKLEDEIADDLALYGWSNVDEPIVNPVKNLNITDWRDLQVGDIIECLHDSKWSRHFIGEEVKVIDIEGLGYSGTMPINVQLGSDDCWGREFKFIRRPAK